MAETINFRHRQGRALPAGWTAGVTGRGTPRWTVEADATAPSKPNVLKQSGTRHFSVVREASAVSLADGFVEVKFKPISGKEDQAGGVVWRWKDGDNYYVARANALENNVSLYYTENGSRKTIKYVDAPVPGNTWHTLLRVEFSGTRIKVMLDGKAYIEVDDSHIAGAGAVGVWTKADSVTLFDDFSFGWAVTQPGAPDVNRLLVAKGLRAFGDGFVSLLLPVYLLELGFSAARGGHHRDRHAAGLRACSRSWSACTPTGSTTARCCLPRRS